MLMVQVELIPKVEKIIINIFLKSYYEILSIFIYIHIIYIYIYIYITLFSVKIVSVPPRNNQICFLSVVNISCLQPLIKCDKSTA